MNIIQKLEQRRTGARQRQQGDPGVLRPGDTVSSTSTSSKATRKRVQAYEGVVIGRRNRGLNSSFVVRKVSSGEGVERTFQLYSPTIASIEVKRRGDVRRAKLYYLRDRSGKSARIREKLEHKGAGRQGGRDAAAAAASDQIRRDRGRHQRACRFLDRHHMTTVRRHPRTKRRARYSSPRRFRSIRRSMSRRLRAAPPVAIDRLRPTRCATVWRAAVWEPEIAGRYAAFRPGLRSPRGRAGALGCAR